MHLAVMHMLQREAGLHEPFQDLRLAAGLTHKMREELVHFLGSHSQGPSVVYSLQMPSTASKAQIWKVKCIISPQFQIFQTCQIPSSFPMLNQAPLILVKQLSLAGQCNKKLAETCSCMPTPSHSFLDHLHTLQGSSPHFSHWCLSALDLHMDVSPISIVHDLSQEACHVNMRPHEAPSQEDYIKQTLQGPTGHWASLNPRGNMSPARRSKVSSPAIWGHHDTQTMLSGDEDLKWQSMFPWYFHGCSHGYCWLRSKPLKKRIGTNLW